jgi:hypothetical protein
MIVCNKGKKKKREEIERKKGKQVTDRRKEECREYSCNQ